MAGSITSPLQFQPDALLLLAGQSRQHISVQSYCLRCLPAATVAAPPLRVPIRRRLAGRSAASSDMAMGGKTVSDDRMLVFVPPHPLIKHWVSVLRNEQTPCAIFRSAMAELGRLLIYEATRDWLPTVSGEIDSPMGAAAVEFIDPREPVAIVPILRAGLALSEHASTVLPATITYHLGMRRDETTLEPSIYLNNLPNQFPEGSRILVLDPMLATAPGLTRTASAAVLKSERARGRFLGFTARLSMTPHFCADRAGFLIYLPPHVGAAMGSH